MKWKIAYETKNYRKWANKALKESFEERKFDKYKNLDMF